MAIAMYPGSFDPITKGHLDIIKRASKMFDEVIVAVMVNPRKVCTFTLDERISHIKKCVADYPNIKVVSGLGLTINLANELGATILIRGIRAVADYEYELSQATTNMMLDSNIETIFLVAKPEYSFLSSSIAKEIAMFKGNIDDMIPSEIIDEVKERLINEKSL